MQWEQNKINHTHTHTQLRVPPQSLSCFLKQKQGRGAEGCRSLASRPLPLGCLLQPRVINSKRLPGCGGAGLHCFRIFALKFVSLPRGLWPRGLSAPLEGLERSKCTVLTCSLFFQTCLCFLPTATVKCAFLRLFSKQRKGERMNGGQ